MQPLSIIDPERTKSQIKRKYRFPLKTVIVIALVTLVITSSSPTTKKGINKYHQHIEVVPDPVHHQPRPGWPGPPADVTDPRVREMICLCVLTALAISFTTMSGFGEGIIFQIGYWFLSEVEIVPKPSLVESVVCIFLALMLPALINTILLWHDNNWTFTGIFWFFRTIGSAVGSYVLVNFHDLCLVRGLGILFAASFFAQVTQICFFSKLEKPNPHALGKQSRVTPGWEIEDEYDTLEATDGNITESGESDIYDPNSGPIAPPAPIGEDNRTHDECEPDGIQSKNMQGNTSFGNEIQTSHSTLSTCSKIWLSVAAFLDGFSGGLFSIHGPPVMIYCLIFKTDKNTFLAAIFLSIVFGNGWVTVIYSGVFGGGLERRNLYVYVGVVVGGLIGFAFGRINHDVISQRVFENLLRMLLLGGSAMMITYKAGEEARLVSIVVGSLTIVTCICVWIWAFLVKSYGCLMLVISQSKLAKEVNERGDYPYSEIKDV